MTKHTQQIELQAAYLLQLAIRKIQNNDFRLALVHLEKLLSITSEDIQALLLWSQCHHALGNYQASEGGFKKLLDNDPENAFYHHCLAILFNDAHRPSCALPHAQRATELAPQQHECWSQLSIASLECRDMSGALLAAEKSVALSNSSPDALRARAYALLNLDNMSGAFNDFTNRMMAIFGKSSMAIARKEFISTSKAKILHDIEQYQYLFNQTNHHMFGALAKQHQELLAQLPNELPANEIINFQDVTAQNFATNYNRLHHFTDAGRIAQGAINTNRDFSAIEFEYKQRAPGITWIDNFLSDEALLALRKYCLENTFWFDFHHPDGYLGALMENGFSAPLLQQITEELRQSMPGIFKDYPLIQMWAFKYDSCLKGIQMHADIAAVNLNFWITPENANLDPESGGLVIWDKEAPEEWAFSDYNSGESIHQKRIQDFLSSSGAKMIRVPYRENRAVLFNSDLFHRTDDFQFKAGYENRRINITLLFGRRKE